MIPTETLIYEHYKEPLQKVEDGFGYYGTLAMTDDKENVQCHECGKLFPHLGLHARQHGMTAGEYKEKYKLGVTTALISDKVREKLQQVHAAGSIIPKGGDLPEWLKEYNRKVQSGEITHPGSRSTHGSYHLERRNQLGICPQQVLEKIRELAEKLGHTPSEIEFKDHYKYRYYKSICYQHGSYLNAVKKLGLKSAKELKEPDNEQLLQELRDFHEQHGRVPMSSDFARGLLRPRAMYFRRFGTLNNARLEAGLNAVVAFPFGKYVEMYARQYEQYKKGHGITAEAIRQRKKRERKKQLKLQEVVA